MRKLAVLLVGVLLIVGIGVMPAMATECAPQGECLSPGFWKNHPDAWPVDSITIGGTTYTKAQAIEWMNMSVSGDKSLTLFKALVAAKLNVLNGCPPCSVTCGAIAAADEWLADNPLGSGVLARSCPWQSGGECLYLTLDCFNNS